MARKILVYKKNQGIMKSNKEDEFLFTEETHDENGQLVEYIRYLTDGTIEEQTENKFDSQGRIIESIFYHKVNEQKEKTFIQYEGNTKIEELHYMDGSIDKIETITNSSGQPGQITEWEDKQLIQKSIFEYDSDNQLLRKIVYDDQDEVIEKIENNYEKNKVVLQSVKTFDNQYEIEFEYEDSGNMKGAWYYQGEDLIESEEVFHNQEGKQTKNLKKDGQGNAVVTTEIEYLPLKKIEVKTSHETGKSEKTETSYDENGQTLRIVYQKTAAQYNDELENFILRYEYRDA